MQLFLVQINLNSGYKALKLVSSPAAELSSSVDDCVQTPPFTGVFSASVHFKYSIIIVMVNTYSLQIRWIRKKGHVNIYQITFSCNRNENQVVTDSDFLALRTLFRCRVNGPPASLAL